MKVSLISCCRISILTILIVSGISCSRSREGNSEENEIDRTRPTWTRLRTRPTRPRPFISRPLFSDTDDMMNHLGEMEKGNCMLENAMVPITDQLPEKDKSLYFPTCVKVQQCKGCCMGNRKCIPTSYSWKTFQINRTDTEDSVTVRVKEHTGCSCDCKYNKENCPASIGAKFDPKACTCMCLNSDEEKKCHKMHATHKWVAATCSCICKRKRDCITGEKFNMKSCKCENKYQAEYPTYL